MIDTDSVAKVERELVALDLTKGLKFRYELEQLCFA